jgi:predicted RNA-binding Zn ribbon-like protein
MKTAADPEDITAKLRLCLDFANTVDWRSSDNAKDKLKDYSDLVTWSKRAGLYSNVEARNLLRKGISHPRLATHVLKRATAFREVVYRIFSAIAAGQVPHKSDVNTLNRAVPEALSHLVLLGTRKKFVWHWSEKEQDLESMLWPIVWSTSELLTSNGLTRVRECAANGCGWLFLDVSRNGLRRWCDMKSCGNRAKARRHYARKMKQLTRIH